MSTPTLYYHPVSFYSQKVLVALFEKGVDIDKHLVNIFDGEQLSEWFLKINSKGEVPVLEINGRNVPESDVIINLIDKEYIYNTRKELVPDETFRYCSNAKELRQAINAVPIEIITYGILANRELCTGEILFPKSFLNVNTREDIDRNFSVAVEECRLSMETCQTQLKRAYKEKHDRLKQLKEKVLNKTEIVKCLYRIEPLFEKLAARLERTAQEHPKDETYLFGTEFVAADISAAILFYRLETMGVNSRYYSSDLRPLVLNYCNRLMARPSVVHTIQEIEQFYKTESEKQTKETVPERSFGRKVLTVSLLAGVLVCGYFGYKELARRGMIPTLLDKLPAWIHKR